MTLDVNLFGNPVNALFVVSGYLCNSPEIDTGITFTDENDNYFASVQNAAEIMNINFFNNDTNDISEYFIKSPVKTLEMWILPLCKLGKSFNISCNSNVVINFNNVTKSITVNMKDTSSNDIKLLVDMLTHCEYAGSIDFQIIESILFNYCTDGYFETDCSFKISKKDNRFYLSEFSYSRMDMNFLYSVIDKKEIGNYGLVSVNCRKDFKLDYKKSQAWHKDIHNLISALKALQTSIIFERSLNQTANEFLELLIYNLVSQF